jgi:hypothetical protein
VLKCSGSFVVMASQISEDREISEVIVCLVT